MANIYVRSTDGSDADNGSTWALAKATIAGAAAIDAVGDTIFVSQNHNESSAGINCVWAGTVNSPTKIVCVNDGAEPPTAVATTAQIGSTSGTSITPAGSSSAYFYGFTFNVGASSGGSSFTSTTTTHSIAFDTCNIFLTNTNAGSVISIDGDVTLINTWIKYGATGQHTRLGNNTKIRGGGVASGTSPTTVFKTNTPGRFLVEGFDFSNCSSSVNLYDLVSTNVLTNGIFRNCKLPASWSGSLVATVSSLHPEVAIEMINCASGATNYSYWRQTYYGSIRHETTVVKTSGASDGTTPLSWKMVSTANTVFPINGLRSADIIAWNVTTGSSVTATVEIVTDNVTLKDDEAYLEVMYLGSSGAPLSSMVTDAKADVLATAANQTSSSVAWTTTGLTTPVKQKLTVTFTPQMVGFVIGRVVLCKASTTVYVDPKMTIA